MQIAEGSTKEQEIEYLRNRLAQLEELEANNCPSTNPFSCPSTMEESDDVDLSAMLSQIAEDAALLENLNAQVGA